MKKTYEKVTNEEVAAAQRGEPGAAELVLKKSKNLIEFWVRRMRPRTEDETAEMRQEALIGVFRAIGTYRAQTAFPGATYHFGGWATYYIRTYVGRVRWGTPAARANRPEFSSLDAPVSADGETSLIDLLPDETGVAPDDATELAEQAALLKRARHLLSPRLQQVWVMRFEEGKTLKEIGDLLGCTRERVRQMLHTDRIGAVAQVTRLVEAMQQGGEDGTDEGVLRSVPHVRPGRPPRTRVGSGAPKVLRPATPRSTGDAVEAAKASKASGPFRNPTRLRVTRRAGHDSESAEARLTG